MNPENNKGVRNVPIPLYRAFSICREERRHTMMRGYCWARVMTLLGGQRQLRLAPTNLTLTCMCRPRPTCSNFRGDENARHYKKLSYRRGTARRAASVETVRNVAQVFVELHLQQANNLQGHSRSLEMARIDRLYDIVVCSNDVAYLSSSIFEILLFTHCTWLPSACNVEKSVIVDKQL